jgi:hypothetical protein
VAGEPTSVLTLEKGTDVLSSDGERIGAVEHVLYDEDTDIFDGIVIDTRAGPGGWRFADAPQVAEIRDDAVILTVSAAEAEQLPDPEPGPAVVEHRGVEDVETPLEHKLRRAWEIISGKG